MRLTTAIALASLAWSEAGTTTLSIGSCADLQAAAAATSSSDVIAELQSTGITCDDWTTIEITTNKLKIVDSLGLDAPITFENIRFLVSSGILRIEPEVEIAGEIGNNRNDLGVNGGVLHVAKGARAKFLSHVYANNVGLEATDSTGDGGCIYNNGLIRFESSLEFDGCSVIADEGTMLVSGGAIWNGEDGTIVIKGDVNAGFNVAVDSSTTESDEWPQHQGGAIYNKGKISVFSAASFVQNEAPVGGAIYNEGVFKFLKSSFADFYLNRAFGLGGAQVFNSGTMLFKGGAKLFFGIVLTTGSRGGGILNYGTLRMSGSTEFIDNQADEYGGAIATTEDAILDLPDDTVFDGNYVSGDLTYADCDDIYVENDTGYTCLP